MAVGSTAPDSDDLDQACLRVVEHSRASKRRRLAQGEVLYWQGDAVEHVFVVRAGMLKEYALLPESKAYTYCLLERGGLAGATACPALKSTTNC